MEAAITWHRARHMSKEIYWKNDGKLIPGNGKKIGLWLNAHKIQHQLFTQKGGAGKKKKEAKKKNVAAIWKTEGVSHIPARQANNKLINPYL